MQQNKSSFEDLLTSAQHSAYHLEMRDVYAASYEEADFKVWQKTGKWENTDYWQPWISLIQETTGRGVLVRRVHLVSVPLSESARFEYAGTVNNLVAGEDVRWLPRSHAVDIALPGADFWIFDSCIVRFGHFAGDGQWICDEIRTEPAIANLCRSAFEAVWERATPHADFVA